MYCTMTRALACETCVLVTIRYESTNDTVHPCVAPVESGGSTISFLSYSGRLPKLPPSFVNLHFGFFRLGRDWCGTRAAADVQEALL
jgi:hypothetical protein